MRVYLRHTISLPDPHVEAQFGNIITLEFHKLTNDERGTICKFFNDHATEEWEYVDTLENRVMVRFADAVLCFVKSGGVWNVVLRLEEV